MTNAHDNDLPTDEELVAYLDGELTSDTYGRMVRYLAIDHDLQRRLILLSGGQRPFREAFALLLEQAPQANLKATLASLPGPVGSSEVVRSPRGWGNTAKAMVAGLLLFMAGLGAGWLAPALNQRLWEQASDEGASADNWRQAVAEYLTLFTAETLAVIPDIPAAQEQELAAVGNRVGLKLSPQMISLPNLSFKRAQFLEYDNKPLGQLVYLEPGNGPVALCITADVTSGTDYQTEQRQGFNIVYWSRGRYNFMLIGHMPASRLQEYAGVLSYRLK
ncbi:anti-sigma factor family protein [Microvirga rosea]|uniref:anti-sigma factor family protein n=1 Tax=Microvirga rosea TaxID=2715425 RepID=UPI001D09BAC3|nr:anti-sigma factor [Microvirga rosea]MCB8822508.1 anti-sigma factor [Microvirga rosea]